MTFKITKQELQATFFFLSIVTLITLTFLTSSTLCASKEIQNMIVTHLSYKTWNTPQNSVITLTHTMNVVSVISGIMINGVW